MDISVEEIVKNKNRNLKKTRMVLILPEYSQRPYRYGMTLLCVGAMFNWLGLAENNAEPVRYIGVTLIAAGAMLICLAMCFWMKASHDPPGDSNLSEDPMHHIVTIHQGDLPLEKPPDYDSVTGCSPPCYEEAIRLNPSLLLPNNSSAQDVTDSTKQQADVTQGLELSTNTTPTDAQNNQSCPASVTNALPVVKTEDDGKTVNTIVTTSPSEVTTSEDSSQTSDNFGSRMLRLSKRLLRVKRGSVNPQDGESSGSVSTVDHTDCVPVNNSDQLVINNSRNDNNSAASTSTLPVR